MCQPIHIVFLDDEQQQLDAVKRMLRKEDFRISFCTKADDALALLRQGDVAAFFSDQYMPGLKGLEVLAQAREIAPHVPRGMISGKADLALATEAINSGVVHFFLVKPVRREELLAVVEKALALQDIQRTQASALAQAREESLTDPLTGLWNRRYLEQEFERALAGARRHEQSLTLLFLDLNDFKKINDTVGHDAGDVVLCKMAAFLRETCRTEDLPARFAGDEFALLLPDTDVEQAQTVIDRLCRAQIYPDGENPEGICATISVGLANFPRDGDTVAALLQVADHAMYAHKRAIKSESNAGAGAAVQNRLRMVLLVDDEAEMRRTLRRQLRHDVDVVLEAGSGEEAIRLLGQEPIGCIISDLSMPGLGGVDVLAHAAEAVPDAKRILLTAHGDYESSADAINRGHVHLLLRKPWKSQELIAEVRKAFPATQYGEGSGI